MKRAKKFLALLLAFAMLITLLAACGEDKKSSSQSNGSSQSESANAGSDSSGTEPSVVGDGQENGEIHPVRIVQPGTLPAEYEAGIAAVNEKLKEDGLNIEVSVQRIPWDSYDQKLNLMLTTGEEFELLHVMQDVKNLSAIAGMGAIIPIDEILEKYPDLVGRFTDLDWKGALYNGKRYAVPSFWKTFDGSLSAWCYRKDVAEAVGYKEMPNTPDGMIEMMKKSQEYILDETGVKAYHWMHQNQNTAHWLHRYYDTYPFYVENSLGIILSRQDGTIDSYYESEEFKKDSDYYYQMYQAGLINPDILNLDSQVKYDQANLGAFLPSQTFDAAIENTIKRETGIDTTVVTESVFGTDIPEVIYTYAQNLNAVSSTAEDPESAVKFLDWLYASQENHDLFHYGIEGTHFTAVGDNRMIQMKGEDDNPLYYLDHWMTGYMPYIRFADDTPDNHIQRMQYKAENYVVSPIAGFIFDSSNVTSELTNLQTEIISSIYPIKWGMIPYEENIDDAIAKLKAAGLDKYMEEYRTQFQKYLEENPDVMEMAKGSQK